MSSEAAQVLGAAAGTAVVLMSALLLVGKKFRPWFRLLDDLTGEEERPGRSRQPGLLERVAATEDTVRRIENRASAAEDASLRTEDLMRRHMANGLEIMEVGVHNDRRLYTALEQQGIEITDLRDYPDVDTGED